MRQIPGIAESHLGIGERENQTETLQSSERWPWLHAQPCGTGQLPETWPSTRSSGQWLCVIFPVPINRWHWPCARVCDQPLHLPSPHSLWLSRAWGRSRLCARHLCRRHLKLSSFPAPPPEGISTKLSLLARLSTGCWLWWEQEQSRCAVVALGRGWSILSHHAELSHAEKVVSWRNSLIPPDISMLLAQSGKITFPSSSGRIHVSLPIKY